MAFGQGTDNAWDEATVLVLTLAGLADDAANLDVEVSPAVEAEIQALLDRRIRERRPLAHLLGRWWFAGHEFLVSADVVIPRSPIGEMIGRDFEPWLQGPPARVLDLCTGTGCIAVSVALAFPGAEVHGVDIDPSAVALARRNASLHRLTDRVHIHRGDLYDALPAGLTFDLIVSNPPYVDAADLASLPPEFRAEPARGLSGGEDGLRLIRRIVDEAPLRLNPGGVLVCEVGMSAAALLAAYPATPFVWPEFEHGGEGVFVLGADLT